MIHSFIKTAIPKPARQVRATTAHACVHSAVPVLEPILHCLRADRSSTAWPSRILILHSLVVLSIGFRAHVLDTSAIIQAFHLLRPTRRQSSGLWCRSLPWQLGGPMNRGTGRVGQRRLGVCIARWVGAAGVGRGRKGGVWLALLLLLALLARHDVDVFCIVNVVRFCRRYELHVGFLTRQMESVGGWQRSEVGRLDRKEAVNLTEL